MASGSNNNTGGGTTIQKTEPWDGIKPFLLEASQQAQNLYSQGGKPFYPGQTYTSFDPATTAALSGQENFAKGNPLTASNMGLIDSTLRGDFLSGNPQTQALIDSASSDVVKNFREATAPTLNAEFAKAGRMGSSAHGQAFGTASDALAKQLGDISTGIRYQNYGDERTRQMQAAGLAPSVSNMGYTDLSKLAEVGTARENQAQLGLDEDMSRYYYDPEGQALDQYLQRLGQMGNYSTTSGSNANYTRTNPLTSALGGGMAGAQIGSFFGPWGTAIGAGLGGIGGLLF